MKTYKIPITWESYKDYEVEAENLQEAVTIALRKFLAQPDENYINDSWSIDNTLADDYPDEKYDEHQAINKILK